MTSPTMSNKPSLDVGNDVTTSNALRDDADFGSCPSDRSPGIPGNVAKERPLGRGQRSSPFSSPETKKRTSWRKTVFMKELGALGHEIRRAGDSIRGSMESLIGNSSSSNNNKIPTDGGPGEEKRRIRIEPASDVRSTGNGRRKGTPAEVDGGDWNSWIDDVSNDHNFSSALIVTNLENGLFFAQVAMDTIPFGDIVIRIRNYRLEIVLDRRRDHPPPPHPDRRSAVDSSHRIVVGRTQLIGTIDVPIYVDTSTLHFRLDAERDVLHLEGVMKGCLDREHSASAGDLRGTLMATHNFRKKLKAKVNARATNDSDVNGSLDDGAKVKQHQQQQQHAVGHVDSWVDRFRSRAYTH